MSHKFQPIRFFDRKVAKRNCFLILEVEHEALNFIPLKLWDLIREALNYEDELLKILTIQPCLSMIGFLASKIRSLCRSEDSFHVNEMRRFVLDSKFLYLLLLVIKCNYLPCLLLLIEVVYYPHLKLQDD